MSAVELTAEALRAECVSGPAGKRLPGVRILADQLGVSPPTVAAALAKLAAQGIVVGGGLRRAFHIAGTNGQSAPTRPARKRLLILIPEELDRLPDTTRRLVQTLRDEMAVKGWHDQLQVLDFRFAKRPLRAWDRLIGVDPDTAVVAIHGRVPLATWALERKVRMLFLGGATGGLPIPMIGVSSSRMAHIALARLTAMGHRRVMLPLCNHPESFKDAMRGVTRQALEAIGQPYAAAYHNPESDYLTPDVIWRLMESAFAKHPPTAVVLLDWTTLVAAFCYLAHQRLRVPEDVSLVLLGNQAEAEWFQPELARFRFPLRRMAKAMAHWLEHESGPPIHPRFTPTFIAGHSLGRPGGGN